MRHALVIAMVAFLAAGAGWSQTVDDRELKSVGERDIVFENYTGTYSVFDTAEEIVGIGRTLALAVRAGASRADFFGLYSVIRAVDPKETRKLDSDILVLEPRAGVAHIKNLRRIIAGYVETAFGYSRADAELLAVFASYYNAVYRGKTAEMAERYSAEVMRNVTAENVGLALSYRDWPGKTRILLPLARAGVLPVGSAPGAAAPGAARPGAVSTTELTEKRVVEQLRSEPEKGLTERKAMVDLKEREIEAAKSSVAAEEKKLEERKAEVAKQEAQIAAQPAAAAPAAAPTQPAGQQPAQPAAQTPQPTAAAKAVAEEKKGIAEAEKKLEDEKQAVAAKEAEVARDREGIVTDEKSTPAAAAQPAAPKAVAEEVLFLAGRLSAEGARLVVIDPVARSGGALSAGGITNADFSFYKESVVVLAREGSVVRLVLLDPKTLAVKARGTDAMHPVSYVHTQAGAIYAVTLQAAGARLARYDEKLSRVALSTDAVDPNTYVRVFGEEVYASAPDGSILALSAADLTRKGQIAGPAR